MSTKNITIPAVTNGQPGVYTERTEARVLGVTYATGNFTLRVGNEGAIDMSVGKGVGTPNGPPLGRLQLFNSSSAAIDLTVYLGNDEFRSSVNLPAALITNRDLINGSGPLTLAAGNSDTYPGFSVFGAVLIRRRIFRVSNLDTTATHQLTLSSPLSGNGLYGEQVWPSSTVSVETSADIAVSNLTAFNIDYRTWEIFDKVSGT